MKILITGTSGMVGSNLKENDIIKENDLWCPTSKELDLLNYDNVYSYIKKYSPDLVIHCAGLVGGIQANIKNPVDFLVKNLDVGKNVVQASHKLGVKKLLNLGSSCMYPRNIEETISEEMILKGELEPTNEGYAIAKIAVAKLCEYISKGDDSFHYKTLIPCNLYGKFDKFDPKHSHMIPAVIRKIHLAKENSDQIVEIWGDGTARREFMFAEDLATFIGFSLDKLEKLPTYLNVGLGHDYSIKEYYEAIAKIVGFKGEFKFDLSKPTGMKRKIVSVEKLSHFEWTPSYSLEQGIKKTYNYFLEKVLKHD